MPMPMFNPNKKSIIWALSVPIWSNMEIFICGINVQMTGKFLLILRTEKLCNYLTYHLLPRAIWPQAPFRATNVPRPTLVSSNCATAPWLSEEGHWWLCYSICIGEVVWLFMFCWICRFILWACPLQVQESLSRT